LELSALCAKIREKVLQNQTGDRTVREPAQAKCTWTLRKKRSKRELKGKMPQTKARERTGCKRAQKPLALAYCGLR